MDEERDVREDEVQEEIAPEPMASGELRSLGELIESTPDVQQYPPIEETASTPLAPTFWQQVWQRFFPDPKVAGAQLAQRIDDLTAAIEDHPDGAANYVLRGEVYLDGGAYDLALSDFRRALDLAVAQFESDDWGIVAQAMQDRAQAGLTKAKRYLKIK